MKYVNRLLRRLKKNKPDLAIHEKLHPFVESASWADDMKKFGAKFQTPWHFIGQPFFDQGKDNQNFNITNDPVNITAAMYALKSWLMKEKDCLKNDYVIEILKGFDGLKYE